MTPLSIVTVTYNAAETLRTCLDSVAGQHLDVEHLIVDGASTDGTLAILEQAQAAGRIRYISEPDNGIYDAMNKGLRLATGDVIGILNADDFYASPEVLTEVLEVFADKSLDSCYGDLVYVDRDEISKVKRYWRAGAFRREAFRHGWMPPHPTFFVRRRVYEQHGLFWLDLGSAADYELMLRLLFRHRISTQYIPRLLIKMRVGGESNVSLKNRLRANRMDRRAWEVNGLQPRFWTLWAKPLRKVGQFLARAPIH
jgi:glycosyltransferase